MGLSGFDFQACGGQAAVDQVGSVLDLLCPTLPDEAEAYLGFITEPQAGVPVVAMILGYNGPIDDGEMVLAPARQFGRPAADLVGPMPYAVRQTLAG
jgi:hypothetical protein